MHVKRIIRMVFARAGLLSTIAIENGKAKHIATALHKSLNSSCFVACFNNLKRSFITINPQEAAKNIPNPVYKLSMNPYIPYVF